MHETIPNDSAISRRRLLGGVVVSATAVTAIGSLLHEVTAAGAGGAALASSGSVADRAAGLASSPVLGSFQIGYNVRSPNYYQPFLMLNDWGKFVEIRAGGEIHVPYAGITGKATVQTESGVRIASRHPTLKVERSDPATGVHRIEVTGDATGTIVRGFAWSGRKPTFFTVAREGRPEKIAPEWIAGVEGRWVRDLDMSGANGVPTSGTYPYNLVTDKIYRNDTGTGADVPYQDRVDAVAGWMAAKPEALGYWSVIGPDLDDAAMTAIATYQRDNLPARALIALQWSNEDPWNIAFSGARRTMLDAARKGWYGADTRFPTPQPGVTISDLGEGPSGMAGPAAAAGTYIGVNIHGIGYAAWKAKRTVAAGAPVVEGEDWTRDHPVDLGIAGRRWRAIRHDQIIEIYRKVFGQARFAKQICPVVMAQDAIGEFYNQCTIERTFVPGYWDKIVGCGYGWYFNSAPDYDKSAATAATLEASFRSNMRGVKNSTEQLVADCRKMGKVPFLYEGLPAPAAFSYGDDGPYQRAYDALFSSEPGATLMADIAYYMKTTVPGVVIGYDAVGSREWSLRRTWADTANKRYVGFNRGLAAGYRPAS